MLFKSVISLALLAASAVAEIKFTSAPATVEAGKTYTLTWQSSDLTTPVKIILRKGASANLDTVETITEAGVGGSYSWTPETTLTDGTDYALQIVQGTDFNYYGPFPLSGGSTATATVASSSGAASVSSTATSGSAAASSSDSSASASESSAAASSSESAAATSSASRSSTSATSTSSSVPASGASGLQSPIAFILCAVAAMLYLN